MGLVLGKQRGHERTTHAHGRDARFTGGEIGQGGAAGQPHLLDPEQLSVLRRQRGIHDRDTAGDDPLAIDETRGLDMNGKIREFRAQPHFDAATHLLADPTCAQGKGHHHACQRHRQRPAHEGPQNIGECLHGRVTHLAPRGCRRRRQGAGK